MDIVDRLKIYMEHIGLQISQFADTALIPRPTLSQILSGRNKKISNEILGKLHSAYPALNISWLLFGDEPMEIGSGASVRARDDANGGITDAAMSGPAVCDEAYDEDAAPYAAAQPSPIALVPDSSKRVQTIMVFYSDNSFETFTPAQR